MRRSSGLRAGVIHLACGLLLVPSFWVAADEPAAVKPPWQRLLQGDDAKKAEELQKRLDELQPAGKFADALETAEQLARLREERQGKEHWQAVDARFTAEALRRAVRSEKVDREEYAGTFEQFRRASSLEQKGQFKDAFPLRQQILAIRRKVLGEEHPSTATSYNNLAYNLNAQGKYAEAAEGFRKALAIRRKVLGEEHPDTALSYNNVAFNLNAQGKYAEAQEGYQKALDIHRKVLGEEHPSTALCYNNLASNLNAQGKYAEAQEGLRKALDIRRKVLGEEHPDTAQSYNNVAFNLNAQGKYAEAAEGYRKALAICRKMLGEEHPDTALNYNNLAANLSAQGKYAEAAEGFRKALAIRRKVLGEEHPDTAASYNNVAYNLNAQGKYAEAAESVRKALDIWRKVLGEEHLQTALGYDSVASNLYARGKYAEAAEGFRKALDIRRKVLGEEHPDTASSYANVAANLNVQGKYAEAAEGYRKALDIRRKVLGEEHPDTATSYNLVAANLYARGKYAEAAEGFRKALDIHRKVLGEEHPDTARSYDNLAANLKAQGKFVEAAEGYRKALDICRKVLGEQHPDTARSYNNLAHNLNAQGKYVEAAEGYRKALDICRRVLGEEHPRTATSYNNLAANLDDQGKYAEAAADYRKALDIFRKVLGEQHPDTARSYNNLAHNLNAQGKYAEAAEGFKKALDIFRKVLGEEHPDTALGYNNLASNLNAQGKYAEAAEGYRKAVDIWRKVLGEEHPATATSYNNLAGNLKDQGKYAEAAEGFRKALHIRRKVLGEEHPLTALGYNNLAYNLNAQGKYAEAEELWLRAATSFATVRLHLTRSGLERATRTSERSPLPALAAVLARNGKSAQAWRRYEESLARGTWDDLSARLRRPPAEQAQQAQLTARLQRFDQLIEKAVAVKEETPQQKKDREALLDQRRAAQAELDAFARRLEKTYGPVAGQVFDLKSIQAALPEDTALLGWLDLPPTGPRAADPNGEHWAFLLRAKGGPVCIRLKGSGDGGGWTKEDTQLPARLRTSLLERRPDWKRLARQLTDQRLEPLRSHLGAAAPLPAVGHVVVLPSPALAGVPLELLGEEFTISYALSGTLYTHLSKQPAVKGAGLLALGDPVFETSAARAKERPLPPGGVLLTVVQPGSNAAHSHLRPDDVLVKYGDTELNTPADLKAAVAKAAGSDEVAVQVWREGKTVERRVKPGTLGIVMANQPAHEALAERYRLDRVLRSRGDDDAWKPLAGTRVEVDSLRRLFGAEPAPRLLFDSDASEQRLDELAGSGELGRYRYVHLATHGEVDDVRPLRSAVILARDSLPDPEKQLLAGKPVYDGRLTAEEMLRSWSLNSELVTLSACETALGKYESGEGFVGFAQALLLCGSRSVCLSLWKVDDAATALLMQRFYANLLGKRDGLKAPMSKAQALREAKEWLRNLSRDDALRVAAEVSHGVERGKGRPKGKLLPPLPEPVPAAKDDKPYAHPYYWAAFVLIGDPD
jgi:tetratricopeptide (TPR) repeat protein